MILQKIQTIVEIEEHRNKTKIKKSLDSSGKINLEVVMSSMCSFIYSSIISESKMMSKLIKSMTNYLRDNFKAPINQNIGKIPNRPQLFDSHNKIPISQEPVKKHLRSKSSQMSISNISSFLPKTSNKFIKPNPNKFIKKKKYLKNNAKDNSFTRNYFLDKLNKKKMRITRRSHSENDSKLGSISDQFKVMQTLKKRTINK